MRPSSHALIFALLFLSLFSQLPAGVERYGPPTPYAWAQTGEMPVATIDRARSGSRSGLMTRAYVRTIVINRTSYPLALEIVIEDRKGSPREER
jgi:hypothetical protein